jgi:hypothetical protein
MGKFHPPKIYLGMDRRIHPHPPQTFFFCKRFYRPSAFIIKFTNKIFFHPQFFFLAETLSTIRITQLTDFNWQRTTCLFLLWTCNHQSVNCIIVYNFQLAVTANYKVIQVQFVELTLQRLTSVRAQRANSDPRSRIPCTYLNVYLFGCLCCCAAHLEFQFLDSVTKAIDHWNIQWRNSVCAMQ